MRRLAIGRRLVAAGRRILTTLAECCCAPSSPCDKVFYRYDPCPLDAFEFHQDCQNQARTTPVYMRCDVLCPLGCGTVAGTISPPGIKYREWCHRVKENDSGIGYQPFYDPLDPPSNIPPGATPLPPDAEIVTAPEWCLSGVASGVCGSQCCKCWRYYCGEDCPCAGSTGQKKCTRGNQAFHDLRQEFKCLVGDCAEFDSPVGYDALPPGSVQVGAQGGTCCDSELNGCGALCADCHRTQGVYQFSTDGGCNGEQFRTVEIPFDCCCSYEDSAIEFRYQMSSFSPETCSPQKSEFWLVAGVLPAGQQFGIATGFVVVTQWPPPSGDGSVNTYPVEVTMPRSCSPLGLVGFGVNPAPSLCCGHISRQVSATCGSASVTTNVQGCPEFGSGCSGITRTEIRSVTIGSAGRSAACRAGCQERRLSHGAQPRRRIPTPAEILG